MKKYLLILLLMVTLAGVQAWANLDVSNDNVEEDLQQPVITVAGTTIHVTHAAGQKLEIFDVAGVCVATLRIDSDDKTINLNKGCYIIKVGKVVRKVSIC